MASVTDQTTVSVALTGITDTSGGAVAGTKTVYFRALEGDVNQNGTVSLGDLQAVSNGLFGTVGSTNFLDDVNCNGSISLGDLQDVSNHLFDTSN